MEDLLPHLDWTRSLKSLVILRSHYQRDDEFEDGNIVTCFFNWLMMKNEWGFQPPQNEGLFSLERLWVDDQQFIAFQMEERFLTAPAVKSVIVLANHLHVLDTDRYKLLEHLAVNHFSRLEHLANLKYIRGNVVDYLVYTHSAFNSFLYIQYLI